MGKKKAVHLSPNAPSWILFVFVFVFAFFVFAFFVFAFFIFAFLSLPFLSLPFCHCLFCHCLFVFAFFVFALFVFVFFVFVLFKWKKKSSALKPECSVLGFVFRKRWRPFKEAGRQCSGRWWEGFCGSKPSQWEEDSSEKFVGASHQSGRRTVQRKTISGAWTVQSGIQRKFQMRGLQENNFLLEFCSAIVLQQKPLFVPEKISRSGALNHSW